MDSKGGNPQDGAVNLDKLGLVAPVLGGVDDPASNGQISVEPRVPDTAAIGLHCDLKVPSLLALGDRTDLMGTGMCELARVRRCMPGVRTRKLGLSTWVPTMLKPVPAFHDLGNVKAIRAA